MGIKGLFPYLKAEAPGCIREQKLACYAGRVLAIDASTFLYQFLVAIRTGAAATHLANAEGDATSHIAGFLQRVGLAHELRDLRARGAEREEQQAGPQQHGATHRAYDP